MVMGPPKYSQILAIFCTVLFLLIAALLCVILVWHCKHRQQKPVRLWTVQMRTEKENVCFSDKVEQMNHDSVLLMDSEYPPDMYPDQNTAIYKGTSRNTARCKRI